MILIRIKKMKGNKVQMTGFFSGEKWLDEIGTKRPHL